MLFHAPSFSIGLVLGAAVVLVTGYLPELLAPPPPPAAPGTPAPAAGQAPANQVTFEFDSILRSAPAPVVAVPPDAQAAAGATLAAPLNGSADGVSPAAPDGEMESATPGVLDAGMPATSTLAMNEGPGVPGAMPPGGSAPASTAGPATSPPAADAPATPPSAAVPSAASVTPAAPQSAYMLQAASFRSRTDADRLRAELLLLDLPATTGEVNVGNSIWYRVTIGPFADAATADIARERLRERNLTAIPYRR
jgi:cell division septation protein DedD